MTSSQLFNDVTVFTITEQGNHELRFPSAVTVRTDYDPQGMALSILKSKFLCFMKTSMRIMWRK